MSSQIEELNLTIPDSLDIKEQQRVLIENFSLLRDLVVTPGYCHVHRHKETSDALTLNVYHQISNYDEVDPHKKHVDVDLIPGDISTGLNGVYSFTFFMIMENAGTNTYKIALRESSTVLEEYEFDIHGGGGDAMQYHSIIYEFDAAKTDLNFALVCTTGSPSPIISYFTLNIQRVDNYDIP